MPDLQDKPLADQQREMLAVIFARNAPSLPDAERAKLMKQVGMFVGHIAETAYISEWNEGR